jgi:predicted amidophosphoribosyltransferase
MTKEEMTSKIEELTEENQRLRINFEKEKKNIPEPKYLPYPMSCIVVRGNCPVCGKELKENENIFICDECYKKDLEYRKKGQN